MPTQKISPLPDEQLEEYKLAGKEKRQPRCTYCGEPLDTISQIQTVYIKWTWDAQAKEYVKDDSGGDAEKAECRKCEARDWDFVDFDLVNF